MSINFFDACCKTNSKQSQFGLCDDPPPASNPAYIDENDLSKWIATVINNSQKSIDFYAIDACVVILKANGQQESRCDGLLSYDGNHLIFVELKDRNSNGWLIKGFGQLETTINVFKQHYLLSNYKIKAYICNKQRPQTHLSYKNEIQRFKNNTGLILKVTPTITI